MNATAGGSTRTLVCAHASPQSRLLRPLSYVPAPVGVRFVLYGIGGSMAEVVYTALRGAWRRRDWRLRGETYLWMFPIYGLLVVLYEPLQDVIGSWPWPLRGVVYAIGFTAVELASGWLIARLTGRCPWDYVEAGERWAINPYIRWDYLPLWAAVGLALEPVSERLIELTPAIQDVL